MGGLNKHTTTTTGRVENPTLSRCKDFNHVTDNRCRGEEFTAALTFSQRKFTQEVFVNLTEYVKLYIRTFDQEGGSPEFDEGFKAWLKSNSEALTNNGGNDMIAAVSVMGYDAYFVALEALKAAGSTDSKAVNEALWDVTYDGVSGHIAFDEIGDAARDSAYIKTANTETGAWDFVTVQTVE